MTKEIKRKGEGEKQTPQRPTDIVVFAAMLEKFVQENGLDPVADKKEPAPPGTTPPTTREKLQP